jgi:hypothetical protein
LLATSTAWAQTQAIGQKRPGASYSSFALASSGEPRITFSSAAALAGPAGLAKLRGTLLEGVPARSGVRAPRLCGEPGVW